MSKVNVTGKIVDLPSGQRVVLGQFDNANLNVSVEGIGLGGGAPAMARIQESEDGLHWDTLVTDFALSNEAAVYPVVNTKKFLGVQITATAGVTVGEVNFKVTE